MHRSAMNFSGISDKSYLGKLLRFPLRLIPDGTHMPILQGRLKGKKWIAGSHTHGCWLGSYEYEKQLLFEEIVKKGSVVFDIGANVGFYTLLASVLVGPMGSVYAFEPVPRNLKYLKGHVRLNHLDNVKILEAAVSDQSGMTCFDDSPGTAMGRIATNGKLQVATVKLDELISSKQVPAPDYIKIDVEGGEMLVLSGAKCVLAQSRPKIFLATHGVEVHHECCELLDALGYELQPLNGESVEQTDELFAFHKE